MIVAVLYEAMSSLALPRPVHIVCTGSGDDLELALENAAFQWLHLAFPPLHSLLNPQHESLGTTVGSMSTFNANSEEYFGWQFHAGPVFTIGSGDTTGIKPLNSTELLAPLLGPLSAIAVHTKFFWLDAYAGRSDGGQVIADCRINNNQWPDGKDALVNETKKWVLNNAAYVSHRQVVFFQPTAPPDNPNLKAQLRDLAHEDQQKPSKRNLWQRLFSKLE